MKRLTRENNGCWRKQWVIREPLVKRDRIIFPRMHIKLRLMKQFMKFLDQSSSYFSYSYIKQQIPGMNSEKLKGGILDGPQIRQLINDSYFDDSVNVTKLKARSIFVFVGKHFLGNHKSDNYVELVE